MSETKESKRIKNVSTGEMRDVLSKLVAMNQLMQQALEKLGEKTVSIDGWNSVYEGAALIRKQFSKIIGEANLGEIEFAPPPAVVESSLEERPLQRKTKRDNNSK